MAYILNLFRSLKHILADKMLNDAEEAKTWLNHYICNKNHEVL